MPAAAWAKQPHPTFITEGRCDQLLEMLKPGDFVIMQSGHNDGGALNDNSRARGVIAGLKALPDNPLLTPYLKK